MKVQELYIYPVKSMAGVAVTDVVTEPRGLVGDRRWMLVNEKGKFITQRCHPQMTLIQTQLRPNGLYLEKEGEGSVEVFANETDPDIEVKVFSDLVMAKKAATADAWLSKVFGEPCSLAYMHENSRREIGQKFRPEGGQVSFADAMPMLLLSQASLDDLNSRLNEPICMRHFRPNIVVSGVSAFAEDRWKRIRIGEVELEISCRCGRCVVTTVDPRTGEKCPLGEPLETLSGYRKDGHQIYFGVGTLSLTQGRIRVGDEIEVLETEA